MSRYMMAAGLFVALAAGGLFASAPASAQSVMKQCGAEWKAAKAANTTNGQTWSAFLKDCRARHEQAGAAAAPAAAPAPAPTPTMAAATPAPTPMHTRMSRSAAPMAGQFASEGEAKAKCPTDTVVWVNTKSHKYHYAGNRSYGATKHGGYMCETDAKAAGAVAAHGETPKS